MRHRKQQFQTPQAQKIKTWILLLNIAIFAFVAYSAIQFQFAIRSKSVAEIDALADKAAMQYGVDSSLVKAIIWKESRYRINAVGKAGEIGLMQLHDTAIKEWCQRTGNPFPGRLELFEPRNNINIGTWYLAWTGLHWTGYKSALLLQISEYNAGYGNVSKGWKPKHPQDNVPLENITIPSTRSYVAQVLQRMDYAL